MKSMSRRYSQMPLHFVKENYVEIKWADNSQKFHFQWLRDHCPCPLCKNPSNRQKLHNSGDINFVIPRFNITNGILEIYWPENSLKPSSDPHKTCFNLEYLKGVAFDSRNYQGISWDEESISQSPGLNFDYNHVFSEQKKFKKLLRQLYDYGIVFLHNVPNHDNQVEVIGRHFGYIRETFYGTQFRFIFRTYMGCQKYT